MPVLLHFWPTLFLVAVLTVLIAEVLQFIPIKLIETTQFHDNPCTCRIVFYLFSVLNSSVQLGKREAA